MRTTYEVRLRWYKDSVDIEVPALGLSSWVIKVTEADEEARRIIARSGGAAREFDIEIIGPGPRRG